VASVVAVLIRKGNDGGKRKGKMLRNVEISSDGIECSVAVFETGFT
jgi:hypothetical protein